MEVQRKYAIIVNRFVRCVKECAKTALPFQKNSPPEIPTGRLLSVKIRPSCKSVFFFFPRLLTLLWESNGRAQALQQFLVHSLAQQITPFPIYARR